jgi:predicted nucleic acid-binding protein
MKLPRIVLDNSAALPAFFPEAESLHYDAGLVTNRAKSLIHAIGVGRVRAYVPASFFREFLNVISYPLFVPGKKDADLKQQIQVQWENLLSLNLIVVQTKEIMHHSGILTFEDGCPAADSWYVAAAAHAHADLWMSHEHKDGLVAVASKHVVVRMLSKEAANY